MMTFTRVHIVVCGLVVSLAATAARAQHSDVLIVASGGQTTVGAAIDIDGPGETFDLDTQVFESVLLAGGLLPSPQDFEGDEPGFFAMDKVARASDLTSLGVDGLPSGAGASLALTTFALGGGSGDLLYWDGTGPVAFEPAPLGTSFAFTPATDFVVTDANGGFDGHPIFQLDNGGAGKPADGVYVAAPTAIVDGLAASDPFYLVLLADQLIGDEDDAEAVEHALEEIEEGNSTTAVFMGKDFAFYEEAVEFVEAATVPEPTAWALASLFGAAALVARRRPGAASRG